MHAEIALALLAPGFTAYRRRARWSIALLVAGVGLPVAVAIAVVSADRNAVALGLDTQLLGIVETVGVIGIFARLVALSETWVTAGRPTSFTRVEIAALVAAVVALVAAGVVVAEIDGARRSVAPVFVDAPNVLFDASVDESTTTSAQPSPVVATIMPVDEAPVVDDFGSIEIIAPASTTTTTTTTLPPRPTRPDSGVDRSLLSDVTTVLLLGGDAGPGRSGLRTDTMMLFSIHRPTGRAALVSIPRDMRRLLFPPGSALEARHPYGFDGLTNAVYPVVSSSRSLRDSYRVDAVHPGVVALAQGIGYSLDVTIDDYVLIDMQGFVDLIDAIGGVTLRLTRSLPMPGNIPGAPTQYPDRIGPGVVEMDGTTALGYARSRKADNDYRRAGRQRELLAALAQQVSMTDLALSFGDVAAALGGTLRTSLTPDELADALNVIGGQTAIVESVGLVPPLISVTRPDFQAMARIVGAVQLALVTGAASGY